MKKILHREDHAPKRRAEYPAVEDQLDAIYKLASSLQDQGIMLPDEVKLWIDQCSEVKRKHPKPT